MFVKKDKNKKAKPYPIVRLVNIQVTCGESTRVR